MKFAEQARHWIRIQESCGQSELDLFAEES